MFQRLFCVFLGIIFFISGRVAYSQNLDQFHYTYPAQVPENYSVPLKGKYEELLKASKDTKIKLRDSERFSEDAAYAVKREMSMGNIYIGLNEFETYLNDVLSRILPDSLKKNSKIKVYVSRSASENAGAYPDGTILFNIGMLANMHDEATLAYLLGHELSHYLERHGRNQYMVNIKSQRKLLQLVPFSDLLMHMREMSYSRSQETEADSLGFLLAYNGGYDPQGMVNLTKVLLDLEKNHGILEKKKYKVSLKSRGSHPASMLRFQQATRFQKNAAASDTRKYIVSQEKFDRLRTLAIQEKLNLMVSHNDPLSVVRNTFVAHLVEPENPQYLMLLLEGIRKMVYVDNTLADRGFLTAHIQHNYFARKEGITKNLNYLLPDSNLVAELNARHPTLNQASYQTYDQAFAYFAGNAEAAGLTEVYLSKALYNFKDEKQRNENLQRYIASKVARYPEYAQALLRQDLSLPATSRKLLLVDDIAYTKDQLYGYRSSWLESEQKRPAQQTVLNNYFKHRKAGQEIHFASDYFAKQTQEAADLFDFMSVLGQVNEDNYTYFQISMYDPAYWQYFKDKQISQVEFFEVCALDKTYKKYRHYFAIPPFTAFYLWRQIKGVAYKMPNNRHAFSIETIAFNMSDKYRNVGSYSLQKQMKLTDKRLARKVYEVSKANEKEMSSDKLKKK